MAINLHAEPEKDIDETSIEEDRCVSPKLTSLDTEEVWIPTNDIPPPPGIFNLMLHMDQTYPLDELYDAKLFLVLPRELTFVTDSASINGDDAKETATGGFLILSSDRLNGRDMTTVELQVAAAATATWPTVNTIMFAKTKNGKTVTPLSCGVNDFVRDKALAIYLPEKEEDAKEMDNKIDKSSVEGLDVPVTYGFRFPARETMITPVDITNLKVAVPDDSDYSLTLNQLPIPTNKIGETVTDASKDLKVLTYLAVELQSGENIIELTVDDRLIDKRAITVTGDVERLTHKVYPEKPEADGKTPAYVVIHLRDENGELLQENAYIRIFADKGDIFDVKEDRYKTFPEDGFTVQAIAGKASFKLSPASTSEKRRVLATLEDLETRFDVRFYPEKRPWIMAGGIEGTLKFSKTKHSDDALVDYPADHSEEGTHFDTEAGVFAKGSLGEFTVTTMYDSDRDIKEGTLLEQNTPSTEEGEFYPVYGDESEQFFETKSQNSFYLKIERDLSYFMHGDYQTDFPDDLEYNVYRRTLFGQQLNLEKEDNFRVNLFFSENSQDIIKEEQPGRGISGPYFFKQNVIEFSERILIEVRDRNNREIVLSQEEKRRFTDYTINYPEGWILFNEPIHGFDDDFNPVAIVMIYESETDGKEEPIWGARAEKTIANNLTLGGMYVLEERMIEDKSIYGVDLIYDDGENIKFVAEYAKTDGFDTTLSDTDGDAVRLELNVDNTDVRTRAWYSNVDDGFQNPSATHVLNDTKTFGIETNYDFFENSTVTAEAYREDSPFRRTKVVGVEATQRLNRLELTGGLRWKEETVNAVEVDDFQLIGGIKFTPFEKLTLNLHHEQGLASNETDNFPDRTVGGISYRLTEASSLIIQHEVRRQREQDVALTLIGVDSQMEILPNTTGFMKYSIDDSITGFRTQSHIGLNHNWLVRDDFTLDFGGENVEILEGDNDDRMGEYISMHAGFQYLPQEKKYRLSGQYETRFGEVDTEHVVRVGGTLKLGQNTTLLLRERFFESFQREHDLLFGLAYRPVANDRWNHLMKFRHKWQDFDSLEITKYIGSWHINYQFNRDVTLMGEYAFKYEKPEDSASAFTDLIRGRILWDITKRIDCNAHAGVMRQTDSDTYTLAWGPEIGYKVFQNLWLSAGYNFSGFNDDDFDDAEFWNKGPYIKLRFKFDESILDIFKKPKPEEIEDTFEGHLPGRTVRQGGPSTDSPLPSFRNLLGID